MIDNTRYELIVTTGRKAGVSRPIPLGELSIGTTLDSEFFIGCVDTWHQLLRADASADSRSASASGDALPEQLMRVTLTNDAKGLCLRVEQGFVEFEQRRLLPGESCEVSAAGLIRIGASELKIQPVTVADAERADAFNELGQPRDYVQPMLLPKWFSGRLVMSVMTLAAVSILSIGIVLKQPSAKERIQRSMAGVHTGIIGDDRIVAVVSSSPPFLMTESGARYEVGAVFEDGFTISQITAEVVEFTRGSEIMNHTY